MAFEKLFFVRDASVLAIIPLLLPPIAMPRAAVHERPDCVQVVKVANENDITLPDGRVIRVAAGTSRLVPKIVGIHSAEGTMWVDYFKNSVGVDDDIFPICK